MGVEAADGFELKPKLIVRASLVLVEDEQICADAQSDGQLADDVERRLGLSALIAPELRDMNADSFGESLLCEASFPSEGGESLGEIHRRERLKVLAHRNPRILAA